MEMVNEDIQDMESALPRECIRKDGTPSKVKLDGTHRIAAGGYNEDKQGKWGREVLTRASRLAKEYFSKKWEACVAFYVYSCGYESVMREFLKSHTGEEFSELRALFAYFKQQSANIANKYIQFCKEIENINFLVNYQRVIKKRKKSCKKV